MIVLSEEFEPTQYPGYFWNTRDKKLYSCKIDGILKPLKLYKAHEFYHTRFCKFPGDYYQISVKGQSKIYPLITLFDIKPSSDRVTFPVQHKRKIDNATPT